MNENDIGARLAKLVVLQGADEDRRLARKIHQRDRGRVWLLTGLAVLLWAIAGAGVFFVVYVAIFYLYPKHQQLIHDHAIGELPTERFIEIQALHFRSVELCTIIVAGAFIAATLAAICTLLLILVSRRVTLRQINANLVEIFEQLQQQRLDLAHAAPGFDKTPRKRMEPHYQSEATDAISARTGARDEPDSLNTRIAVLEQRLQQLEEKR